MRKIKTLALAMGIAFAMAMAPVTAFAGEIVDTTESVTDETSADTSSDTTTDTSSETTSTTTETTTTTTTTSTASQSDSSLATLGISPGTISPSFSPSVTEYYATLDAGTTEIKVFATPNSSAAGIAWVTGSKTLVDGENTVKVCCGAPNGNATVYIIHVTVGSSSSTSTSTSTDTSTSTETTTDTTGTDTSTETDLISTENEGDASTVIGDTVTENVVSSEEADVAENGGKRVKATLDKDGNLIYKKKVYSLNSDIPSGDYVSMEKYNGVYEQYQAARKKNTTIIIIAAIVAVVLIIVIINLIMRIKDKKEELETFYANEPFEDMPLPDPKREMSKKQEMNETRTRVPEPVANPNTTSEVVAPASQPKTVAPAPSTKPAGNDTSDDDIEFIDLD